MLILWAFLTGLGSPQWQLAHRTGRESCWVQFYFREQKKLCVPHSLWVIWLGSSNPDALDLDSHGVWRSFSPPENLKGLLRVEREGSGVRFDSRVGLNSPLKKQVLLTKTLKSFNRRLRSSMADSPEFKLGIFLRQKIERLREQSAELIKPFDRLGLVRSLILGEGTSSGLLPILRRLGWVHLVTASGIHLYALMGWIQSLIYGLGRWIQIPVGLALGLSRVLSLGFCFLVWLLAGARLGMLRPALVILLRSLGTALGLSWTLWTPLVSALVIEGVVSWLRGEGSGVDSEILSGRWIYALAVGGGLFWHDLIQRAGSKHMQLSRRQKWKEKMIGHLGLAFGSWVLVAWVEIWETGLVSIATPLLSWISIPWTALVIYPVTLLSLVLSWFGFGGVAQSILKWDCVALEFFVLKLTRWTMWPGNLWVVSRWSFVVGGVLATLILCASARFKTRLKTTLIMAGLILAWRLYFLGICEPRRQSSVPQSLARRVIQLDVGQGDAALILGDSSESSFGLSSHLSVGLIDAGSERTLPWDSWIQLLAKLGMTQVSWIGLTHLDEDHAGGLIRLAHLVPIRCVATSPAEIATSRGKRLASRLAQYGVPLEPWAWGCVPHPVLEPDIKKVRTRRNGNENMSAIWVPMRAGGFYLSAGDSNQKDELRVGRWVQSLARDHFAQLQSAFGQSTILPGPRLLKISHHGSRYSTSEEFLNTVQPTEVWISSGQGNRYGHPSVQTLDLLKNWGLKKGIKLRRTDQEGVLVWR